MEPRDGSAVAAWDPDADLPAPPKLEAVFDDGLCPETKICYCPKTHRPFVNRCTKDAFHGAGCLYEVTAEIAEKALQAPKLPGFR